MVVCFSCPSGLWQECHCPSVCRVARIPHRTNHVVPGMYGCTGSDLLLLLKILPIMAFDNWSICCEEFVAFTTFSTLLCLVYLLVDSLEVHVNYLWISRLNNCLQN